MSKKTIDIFTDPSMGNGCCCSCNCSTADYVTTEHLARRFEQKHHAAGTVKIHKLTEQTSSDFVSMVNKILKDSGERLTIKRANMDFVLAKLLPLIAVDGRIISVKNYPDEDQLYHAVTTGERIPTQPSCC